MTATKTDTYTVGPENQSGSAEDLGCRTWAATIRDSQGHRVDARTIGLSDAGSTGTLSAAQQECESIRAVSPRAHGTPMPPEGTTMPQTKGKTMGTDLLGSPLLATKYQVVDGDGFVVQEFTTRDAADKEIEAQHAAYRQEHPTAVKESGLPIFNVREVTN